MSKVHVHSRLAQCLDMAYANVYISFRSFIVVFVFATRWILAFVVLYMSSLLKKKNAFVVNVVLKFVCCQCNIEVGVSLKVPRKLKIRFLFLGLRKKFVVSSFLFAVTVLFADSTGIEVQWQKHQRQAIKNAIEILIHIARSVTNLS